MSEIILDRVSKLWGTTKAVDDISFTAPEGGFLVLLGPSGCGKSTTLRMIAGLEDVSAGRILIAGGDVTTLTPSRRRVSMVFQSYALFPHLSVAENIVFGLKVRKVEAAERQERLTKVAEIVGLADLLALARAIIAENHICLMDEPLSNLDAKLRQEMRIEIRDLQRRLGMTVVYVTHDQSEAMSMADKVVLLRGGRIEQEGRPEQLYDDPATVFVAGFIGTPPMNLVELADGPEGAVIAGGSEAAVFQGPGTGYTLGIRPEHIELAEDGGIPAELVATDYLGADTIVTARLGRQSLLVRVPGRVAVGDGSRAHLRWRPEAACLFEADTGRLAETRPPAASAA